MSTRFCRCAIIGVCVLLAMSPIAAFGQYTEYVVRTPAVSVGSADDLRDQLMNLIEAQAPTLNAMRAEEQALRARQKPEVDRLNGAVQALIESQRETRNALTSQRQALREQQTAFLDLHPDASEADIAKLRAEMQALKDRQQPIEDRMKSDLMALIDSQKPARDALRADRMALRDAQRPTRDKLLAARETFEKQIEIAAALEENDPSTIETASTQGIGSDGVAGLEQFAAPAKSAAPSAAPSNVTVSWPAQSPMPTRLTIPPLPTVPAPQ